MSDTYKFYLSANGLTEDETLRVGTVLAEHPIGWSDDEIDRERWANAMLGSGEPDSYRMRAEGESKCPHEFDDATEALQDAVHAIWKTCGRYVECEAQVIYIEQTPFDDISPDEEEYDEWHAEQAADTLPGPALVEAAAEGAALASDEVPRWHVVYSQGRVVLGAFGEALLADAQECARRVEHDTGLPAFVGQLVRVQRPRVGEPVFELPIRED